MKIELRPKHLPFLVLITGLLGFFLRMWILGDGPDKHGLYARQPLPWVYLWLLTGLTIVTIVWLISRLKNPGAYAENYPASVSTAIGSGLAALGFLTDAIPLLTGGEDLLALLAGLTGTLAAVAMAAVAFARLRGRKPFFLCHGAVSLYLALRIFEQCRSWSNEPQLGTFLIPFLALICVMLAAYHLTTFDVDLGKRRSSLFWSLSGVYFCLVSLADGTDMLFYGCMAIWLLTNLCSLRPLKKSEPEEGSTELPKEASDDASPVSDMSLEELDHWLDQT